MAWEDRVAPTPGSTKAEGYEAMTLSECKDLKQVSVREIQDDAEVLASYGLLRDANGVIGWRKESEEHPRNWRARRKVYDTTIIILLELYTFVVQSMAYRK